MSNYILQRENNLYYRRRIPKEFSKFFPQTHEVRIPFRKTSRIQAILKVKKVNILFEELIIALQLDTFDKKEAIDSEYMALLRESIKESYYSNTHSGTVSKMNLQFEQLQCEQSLQTNHSHIASSQIEDIFIQANIDMAQVDVTTYKQVEKLYLHKKLDMLQEVIHTIDPRKDFQNNNLPLSSAPVKEKDINDQTDV